MLEFNERVYMEKGGLFIDMFNRDFSMVSPYRGQNANMHMCEALIAVYEYTREDKYLVQAHKIAWRLTRSKELFVAEGVVCEHFHSDWTVDHEKNKHADVNGEEHIFRPYGSQPGHSMEWAKLLLLLDRYSREGGVQSEEEGWMVDPASY